MALTRKPSRYTELSDDARWLLASCYRRGAEPFGQFSADILHNSVFGRAETPSRDNIKRAVTAALWTIEVPKGRPRGMNMRLGTELGALFLEFNSGFGRTVEQDGDKFYERGAFADFLDEVLQTTNKLLKQTGRDPVRGRIVAKLGATSVNARACELANEEYVGPFCELSSDTPYLKLRRTLALDTPHQHHLPEPEIEINSAC
jgi:hypothetical protein